MSINYNFVAMPNTLMEVLYKKHLTGNQLLVLLAVAEEVLKFPDGRSSLTRELSLRYIANKINIDFRTVGKIIKKLVSMGLIEILKVGKKCIGSLIKLTIPGVAMELTNIVATGTTYNEKCVATGTTNKRTLIKNIEETNNSVAVPLNNSSEMGSLSQGNTTSDFTGYKHNENSSPITPSLAGEKENIFLTPEKFNGNVNNSIPLTPETITVFGREVKNTVGIFDTIKGKNNIRIPSDGLDSIEVIKPETDNDRGRSYETHPLKDSQSVSPPLPKEEFKELSTAAAGIGIKSSLLSTGIKTLVSRECQDIRNTLQDIFSQIKSRAAAIKNKAGYFVSLCQNVELEDLNVPSTIEDNNSDDNNGFRRPPAWMTGEDEPHPGELHQVEAPPVDLLQEKRKAFAEKISNYFTIGRVKYVLSPAGLPQKIIACTPDTLSYVKDGLSLRHVDWKNLPEKLLNDIWFIGE